MRVMNIIKINDNSNKLFYIGGVVRDELLGRETLDVDITYVGNAI
jgi:tRNA nucleotidyltransferase/poly(A) polymerase